jgi:hypothetical protein
MAYASCPQAGTNSSSEGKCLYTVPTETSARWAMSCQEVPKIPFSECRARAASRMRCRVSSTAALRLSMEYLRGANARLSIKWMPYLFNISYFD